MSVYIPSIKDHFGQWGFRDRDLWGFAPRLPVAFCFAANLNVALEIIMCAIMSAIIGLFVLLDTIIEINAF